MGGFLRPIGFCLAAVFLTGCFSFPRSFHALRYRNQKIFIDEHHYYQVGPLPKEWQKKASQNPGILFRHQKTKATLATEALCGAAFEDLPLEILTGHLLTGLEEVKKIKEESWTLSGRKTLYTQASAGLDGVPVLLNIAVVKKNSCEFDFLSVATASGAEQITNDFLNFVKGFSYQ